MRKYIIILGVLVLVIGGVWIYSARKSTSQYSDSTVDFNDNGFTVSQSGKSVSGQYITDTSALDLGISVYPRAKIITEKGAAENLTLASVKITAATYSTLDSREKVESYYKNQIGSDATTVEAVDGSNIYRVVKSKTNIGPFVNVWVEKDTTYFTIIKPLE